jgi:hypothetical protein
MVIFVMIIVCAIAMTTIPFIMSQTNHHYYIANVIEKDRVTNPNSTGAKYLIWVQTRDGQEIVLQNSDSLLNGKFNSSDIYGKIEVGSTYTFDVVGWRIPILSSYENIITIKKVE